MKICFMTSAVLMMPSVSLAYVSSSTVRRHQKPRTAVEMQMSDRGNMDTNLSKSRRYVLVSSILSSAVVLLPATNAFAERSLSTVTESYNRYVPRMVKGFRYLADEMPGQIDGGDFNNIISEITAEKGSRISAMKGTMKIFATAFSDSVLTQSTRELQLATLKVSNELDNVVTALKAGDKEKALEAQSQAVFYAQVYSELANTLLPRTLEPIQGPSGTGKRFREVDNSINGAF
mmetsp:Transcript_11602/g.17501  ORF Transcript_11602/g.17501 Transcript_11602/m.17501 type:complete len:233 (-) Transcript_11602:168-866(-)